MQSDDLGDLSLNEDFGLVGRELRISISNELLADTDAAGPQATLGLARILGTQARGRIVMERCFFFSIFDFYALSFFL